MTSSKALVIFPIAEITTKVFSVPSFFKIVATFMTPFASFTEAPPNLKILIPNYFVQIFANFLYPFVQQTNHLNMLLLYFYKN